MNTRNSLCTYDTILCVLFIVVLCLPLFTNLSYFHGSETVFFNMLRSQVVESFYSGQLPTWNPLVGPGGSSINFAGVSPWEIKTLFYSWAGNVKIYVLIQFILILGAYVFMCRSIFNNKIIALGLISFLFFYNIDTIPHQIFRYGFTSLFIGFPILFAAIYRLEACETDRLSKTSIRNNAFLFFFSYVFTFNGTQIVLWVVQFHTAILISIFGLRLFFRKRLFRRQLDILYCALIFCGILAHSWQLYWMAGSILESNRMQNAPTMGAISILEEFIRTFLKSTNVSFLATYYGGFVVHSLITGKRRCRDLLWKYLVLLICGYQITNTNWNLFASDTILFSKLHDFHGYFFLACTIILILLVYKNQERKFLFAFDLPILIVVVHYFLFESAHGEGFGKREIELGSQFFFPAAVLFAYASIFHSNKPYRRFCLAALGAIILLRSHITLPMMRINGVVWYMQRDGIYVSVFFGQIVFLGVAHLLMKIKSKQRLYAWSFLSLLTCGLYLSTFRDTYWSPMQNPESYRKMRHELLSPLHLIDSNKRFLIFTSKGVVAGMYMDLGIWQVNSYDSLTSKYTFQTLKKYQLASHVSVPENCRIPFLWFPKNILRVIDCPKIIRGQYYQSVIGNADYNLNNTDLFENLGVQYVISSSNLKVPHLKKVNQARLEGLEQEHYLYKYLGGPYNFLSFEPDNLDCQEFSSNEPISGKTNYFDRPLLKRKILISLESASSGCLSPTINFSEQWRVKVNGIETTPKAVFGYRLGISIPKGKVKIELIYLPHLEKALALSVIGLLLGLFFLVRRTSTNIHPKIENADATLNPGKR